MSFGYLSSSFFKTSLEIEGCFCEERLKGRKWLFKLPYKNDYRKDVWYTLV